MVEVAELKVIGDHSLWLRFSDGQEGVRDCSDILAVVVRWLNLSAIPRDQPEPSIPSGTPLFA